jgi:tripartite-type tricarboxylate transporter receptor subunit TctC
VIARLNGEINRILAEPEVKQRLIDAGANVVPLTLEGFATFVKNESEKYERIIKLTGVKSE